MHSKHAFEQHSCELFLPHGKTRAGHIDFQLWLLWAATLVYCHFYCLTDRSSKHAGRSSHPSDLLHSPDVDGVPRL